MKIGLALLMLFSWLLVASSSFVVAQNFPNGKTIFIWVNGVSAPGPDEWNTRVTTIGDKFLSNKPVSQRACIEFKSVYNRSAWLLPDLAQSAQQLTDMALQRINLSDPDFRTLLTRIGDYASQGSKVVLVGHSQGTLYANLAYEAIRNGEARSYVPTITSLPNYHQLSIVNIATPSWYVADWQGRYTTQCGDILLHPLLGVIGRLPANVNSTFANYYCVGPIVSQGGPFISGTQIHSLENSYLMPGSESQKQIYRHLDESLSVMQLIPPPPLLIATCSADPAVITAGQSATFTGSSSGGTGVRRGSWSGVVSGSGSTATYRTSTSTPPGFGKATYTVTDSGSPKQTTTTTCQVQIKAAVAKGTIIITTNGTVPSVSCKINGTSVNAPGVFRSQSVGSKTLSCTPPNGFTLTSITPSATQTLTAGGEISFKVNLASVQSAPVLNRISVNTEPRVNTRIGVTLGGTGITPPGVDAYYCTSSSTSTCKKVTSFYIYESDSITFSFTPSTTGRFYLRVKKNGAWSNYRTMVVIK